MQSNSSPVQYDSSSSISPSLRFRQIVYATDLARETAVALRLPHTVAASAQILLQRFYTTASLCDHCAVWAAGACVLLAAKVNSAPHSLRHVSNVLYSRLQDREGISRFATTSRTTSQSETLDFYGAEGYAWKIGILNTERAVLCILGFNVTVDMPHKFILVYVNTLREYAQANSWTDLPRNSVFRTLLQYAWNFANDALLLPSCVTETTDTIACACIHAASEEAGMRLPMGWQAIFGASSEQSRRVGHQIKSVYSLGRLRGTFIDFSRTSVFEKFHPPCPQNQKSEGEDAAQDFSSSPAYAKRKRMRFADAGP